MITHKKSRWFSSMFCRYSGYLLRKNFRQCSLTRSSAVPNFEDDVPVVILSNHSSWWDPILAFYLNRKIFKREFFGVMVEEQLRRYGIFRYLGLYSVNRHDRSKGREFLEYTRNLLEHTSRALWIYPQGELLSNEQIPFVFRKGFARIVSHFSKIHILKMVVSYDFWLESKPEIVIHLLPLETVAGSPGALFTNALTDRVAREMTESFMELRAIVKNRDHGALAPLFTHDHVSNPVYEAYGRLSGILTGKPFVRSHGRYS